jgi:hypothetical protein
MDQAKVSYRKGVVLYDEMAQQKGVGEAEVVEMEVEVEAAEVEAAEADAEAEMEEGGAEV